MRYFDHPNVLSLIGVSFDKENNPAMILPFMSNGDIKAYLLSQRVSDTDVDTFPPVMYVATVYKCSFISITYNTFCCNDVAS